MNLLFIVMGIIEILFAIFLSFLTFIIGFKFLSIFTVNYNDEQEIKSKNTAVGILSATFLICIGLLLKEAAIPTVSIIKNTVLLSAGFVSVMISLGYIAIHLVLTLTISILSLFLSIILVTKLSPFKNLDPVKNNNIAFTLVLAATMLVTAMFIAEPLVTFLSGIIPQGIDHIPAPTGLLK